MKSKIYTLSSATILELENIKAGKSILTAGESIGFNIEMIRNKDAYQLACSQYIR